MTLNFDVHGTRAIYVCRRCGHCKMFIEYQDENLFLICISCGFVCGSPISELVPSAMAQAKNTESTEVQRTAYIG